MKRDWIEGILERTFFGGCSAVLRRLKALAKHAQLRGVMILEQIRYGLRRIFCRGASRVPVILANPKWRRVEWDKVVKLVNPAVIFGNSPMSEQARAGHSAPQARSHFDSDWGSTGGVKFAIHQWETLEAACEGLSSFIGHGPINSCCVLPLYHVSGLMQLVRSFVTGGQIAFPGFKAPAGGSDFRRVTRQSRMCLSLVPTQLQRLMAQPRSRGAIDDELRAILCRRCRGARMPLEDARPGAVNLPVVLSYGMTETGGDGRRVARTRWISSWATPMPAGH